MESQDNGKKSKGTGGSRNSEKRRERSKVAARCRRGKESEIFSELAACLPLPENLRKTLDKASVARLALTHLKLSCMMSEVFGSSIFNRSSSEFDQLLNQAMGGFVFVVSSDGDLVYISESVTKCLGLSQSEVMGQSLFDFSHPCDHEDIKALIACNKSTSKDLPISRTGFFRMKCTITSKGRNVHLRAASYKGISCRGTLYWSEKDTNQRWFVGVGEPLSDPTDVNVPLNKQAFVTRHSMDMKCEDVAGDIGEFLEYETEDLVGKSFYDFHHAADAVFLAKNIKTLYLKGQIQTERYRFLAKNGGWVWCITQATILKSESGSKPNGIVCLHFVISGIENRHEILSVIQSQRTKISMASVNVEAQAIHLPDIFPGVGFSNPTPSTTKIFAPKTAGMDSGFLMPADNTFIVSKEEPEDLTHLAPTAGDDCVPLCVPLLDDLLRSFDEASMGYSRNGNMIDLGPGQFPFFMMNDSGQNDSVVPTLEPSPLFLHTDPEISTPLVRPLEQYQPQMFQRPQGMGLDETVEDLGSPSQDVDINDKFPPLLEELSEYRAPFIPTDGGENIELLYGMQDYKNWPSRPVCPQGPESLNGISRVPLAPSGDARELDLTFQPPQPKNISKFSEQNIDQITWTLDIGSIFAARRPEDKPRVMTSSIFTNMDTPPLKVRKMAVAPPSQHEDIPIDTGGQPTTADVRKCPFLKNCRNLKRTGNESNATVKMDSMTDARYFTENRERAAAMGLRFFESPHGNNMFRKRDVCGSILPGREGRLPTFYELTPQDYELMVPLLETSLLQGSELLNALDTETPNSSFIQLP